MSVHRIAKDSCKRSFHILALAMLAASVTSVTRAEEGSRWWPFGDRDKSTESLPEVTDLPPEAPKPRGNPRPRVGTMPMSERNSKWLGWPWGKSETKQQSATPKTSPMNGVQNAGRSVSQATSNAWNKMFSWGGSSAREKQYAERQRQIQQQQQAANQPKKPGFFARLFGGESEEPEGPRTVPEWMAQERPGMNR